MQRYLTAKSVDEARASLLMSAYWKIPLQALVLLVGVLMFVFYLFTPPPMLFNPVHERQVRASARAGDTPRSRRGSDGVEAQREAAAELARGPRRATAPRGRGRRALQQANAEMKAARARGRGPRQGRCPASVLQRRQLRVPDFVMTHLPIGLVGLLIAAIFAAAMSTISAELASLSTATVIDFYRRWWRRRRRRANAAGCRGWRRRSGGSSRVVAIWAAELGSLIEVVNRFGSFFYGSILGVFILAVGFQRANGNGAFVGLFAGMAACGYVAAAHQRRVPLAQRRRRRGRVRRGHGRERRHRRPPRPLRPSAPVASRPAACSPSSG